MAHMRAPDFWNRHIIPPSRHNYTHQNRVLGHSVGIWTPKMWEIMAHAFNRSPKGTSDHRIGQAAVRQVSVEDLDDASGLAAGCTQAHP